MLNRFTLVALAVVFVIAGIVSFYASSSPDGLESVAEDKSFMETAKDPINGETPFADYGTKGIDNERFSVGLSGVVGVAVVFAAAGGLTLLIRGRRRDDDHAETAPATTSS